MDRKTVSRYIESEIWPILKQNGFSHFMRGSAWRFHGDRIDVINFQYFNSYNPRPMGRATISFAVNLGCYLLYIPDHAGPLRESAGKLLPDESQCHMRRRIQPKLSIVQRFFKRNVPKDVWCIDENGSNLVPAIKEVGSGIQDKGFQWFSRFAEPGQVLHILMSEPENMDELWGFGANPSPRRSYYIGYAALRSRQLELATTHLYSAMTSGCYETVENQLRTALTAAASS